MSFPVAFQSAIFYFLACTPCAQVRHRHKIKVEAKKEKAERAKLETAQPGLYRHPSPYNTNPYWQEEIRMGPSLPKKSVSKNSSQRGLMSAGGESSVLSISDHTTATTTTTINGGSAESRVHLDHTMTATVEEDMLSDDWNTRRGYQREDEELWGEGTAGHMLKGALSKARDSAGKLIESTLGGKEREVTDEDRRAFYLAPRNPPVNEYHPPVVSSKPLHASAHKWMLQPPPPAKVMEGKVPVSRAASSGSKSSGKTTLVGEEVHLARVVHDKALKERLQQELSSSRDAKGRLTIEEQLIDSLFNPRTSYPSLYRTRSLSFEASEERIDAARPRSKCRRRVEESEDEFEDIFSPSPKLEVLPSQRTRSTRSRRGRRQMSTRMRRQLASPVGDDSD